MTSFLKQVLCLVAIFSIFNSNGYSMEGGNHFDIEDTQMNNVQQIQLPQNIDELHPSIQEMQALIDQDVDVHDLNAVSGFFKNTENAIKNANNNIPNIGQAYEHVEEQVENAKSIYRENKNRIVQLNQQIEVLYKKQEDLEEQNGIIRKNFKQYNDWLASNSYSNYLKYSEVFEQLYKKITQIINQMREYEQEMRQNIYQPNNE